MIINGKYANVFLELCIFRIKKTVEKHLIPYKIIIKGK